MGYWALGALAAVCAGCFGPSFPEGAACGMGDFCPQGQQCFDGLCFSDAPVVPPDGSPLDAPIAVNPVIGVESQLSINAGGRDGQILWDGSAWKFAYSALNGTTREVFAGTFDHVDVSFTAVLITQDSSESESPAIAWNGSELGIVWSDMATGAPEVRFAAFTGSVPALETRVSGPLEPLSPKPFPGIAPNEDEFVIGYHDGSEIKVAVNLGGPFNVRVTARKGAGDIDPVRMLWDGSNLVLGLDTTTLDPGVVFASSVGLAIAEQGAPVGTDGGSMDFAFAGIVAGLIWEQDADLVFANATVDGFDLRTVDFGPGEKRNPRIVWTGSHFAVVWAQVVGASTRTMLAFLTDTGVLVSAPFEIGEGIEPAIAWSGNELAIVRSSVAGTTSLILVSIVTF